MESIPAAKHRSALYGTVSGPEAESYEPGLGQHAAAQPAAARGRRSSVALVRWESAVPNAQPLQHVEWGSLKSTRRAIEKILRSYHQVIVALF